MEREIEPGPDTYSMYQGQTITEIVTCKPVSRWPNAGPPRGDRKGGAYLTRRVMNDLQIGLTGATAVVQGFGNVGSVTALELHNMGVNVIAVSDR